MPTLPMRFLGLMAEMRDACNHSFLLFTRYIFTSLQTVVSFSRIVSFNFLVQRSPPLHQKLNAMLSRNYNFHLKECWSLILIWLASAQISKFSEHLWAAQNVDTFHLALRKGVIKTFQQMVCRNYQNIFLETYLS